MKRIYILVILLLLNIVSCREDDTQKDKSAVDVYIERLQSGQYDAMELPPFIAETIPDLLKYINNTKRITQFPRNPLSSFSSPDCTVGLYALWTIESIRVTYTQNDQFPGRFPSLSPHLAEQTEDGLVRIHSSVAQQAVANTYEAWWNRSQQVGFYDLMEINPLESTDYRWL